MLAISSRLIIEMNIEIDKKLTSWLFFGGKILNLKSIHPPPPPAGLQDGLGRMKGKNFVIFYF